MLNVFMLSVVALNVGASLIAHEGRLNHRFERIYLDTTWGLPA